MTPTYLHPIPLPALHLSNHQRLTTNIARRLLVRDPTSNTTYRERAPCLTSNMSASGLASGHKYSTSTPSKPSPLRTEIIHDMAALNLEEGEKTPTQESYARESTLYPSSLSLDSLPLHATCASRSSEHADDYTTTRVLTSFLKAPYSHPGSKLLCGASSTSITQLC